MTANPDVGRLVKKSSVRPAIEVDCSAWIGDGPETWTTRSFVKRASVRPAVEVDCSGAGFLELTFTVSASNDAVRLALGLVDLLDAMNRFDSTLGGRGFRKVAQKVEGAQVGLVLAPVQPDRAAERMREICAALNKPDGNGSMPSMPGVTGLSARVA